MWATYSWISWHSKWGARGHQKDFGLIGCQFFLASHAQICRILCGTLPYFSANQVVYPSSNWPLETLTDSRISLRRCGLGLICEETSLLDHGPGQDKQTHNILNPLIQRVKPELTQNDSPINLDGWKMKDERWKIMFADCADVLGKMVMRVWLTFTLVVWSLLLLFPIFYYESCYDIMQSDLYMM